MKKRRLRGSGSIYAPKGVRTLYVKLPVTGARMATGLEDTAENRKKLRDILDAGYLEHKLKNINPFERLATHKTTIGAAFNEFMDSYGASKARKTTTWYKTSYNTFFSSVERSILSEKSLTDAINTTARNYATKSVSVTTYLRGVSVFLNWCVKKNYLQKEIDLEYIKKEFIRAEPAPLPSIFTELELQKIYKHAPTLEFRLFIELLVNTGLRWHEAIELSKYDVQGHYIKLTSKDNKKEQRFPHNSETTRICNELLKLHNGEPLFTYEQHENLYKNTLKLFNTTLQRAGIRKQGRAFHELRKTFISKLCRSGVSPDVATKLARARIDVIMNYYRHFADDELRAASQNLTSI